MLTPANIRYLVVIGNLDKNCGGVRCVEIADVLGVSKPSVHTMMKTLEGMNLVNKSRYGMVFLTSEGSAIAEICREYYDIIFQHFQKDLQFESSLAKSATYALIAEIPLDKIKIMCKHITLNK